MVSFWPWKGEDSSPASFEKALSGLSGKISKASNRLDSLRQRSRRITGLWTLYSVFLYLLYTVILVLVVGWRSWGIGEYAAVLGGPLLFYLVRLGVTSYYHYRTSTAQSQLDDLQKQRDTTIKKLKAATKYDTTQELLKKYGGTPTPKPKTTNEPDRKARLKQGDSNSPQGARTAFVPPPTANIPGRNEPSPLPVGPRLSPSSSVPRQSSSPGQALWQQHRLAQDGSAEFAPNAFPSAPQYAPADDGPRWFDRLTDLLLGEDESLPGKRLALICSNCRLVNGQAPPGTQRLEDVGKWRCMACGSMNGEETDVNKIMASIRKEGSAASPSPSHVENPTLKDEPDTPVEDTSQEVVEPDEESDVTQYSTDGEEKDPKPVDVSQKASEPADTPRRRSARTKKGQKKEG